MQTALETSQRHRHVKGNRRRNADDLQVALPVEHLPVIVINPHPARPQLVELLTAPVLMYLGDRLQPEEPFLLELLDLPQMHAPVTGNPYDAVVEWNHEFFRALCHSATRLRASSGTNRSGGTLNH